MLDVRTEIHCLLPHSIEDYPWSVSCQIRQRLHTRHTAGQTDFTERNLYCEYAGVQPSRVRPVGIMLPGDRSTYHSQEALTGHNLPQLKRSSIWMMTTEGIHKIDLAETETWFLVAGKPPKNDVTEWHYPITSWRDQTHNDVIKILLRLWNCSGYTPIFLRALRRWWPSASGTFIPGFSNFMLFAVSKSASHSAGYLGIILWR